MSAQLLSSKIVIVEEEPRIRSIPALPTAIVGNVGITERGPVGEATLVSSFEEYATIFGGFTVNSEVATGAFGFFLNGGETMWVVRTLHYTDITSKATATGVVGTLTLVDRAGTPLSTLRVDGKTKGSYANSLSILIEDPTSGDADQFNLSVLDDGVVVEVFPNLSMLDADDSFAETIINDTATGSNLIAVTDLDSATSSPGDLPATGTTGPLTAGDDGLTSLADIDFIGSDVDDTGIFALDFVNNLTLLIVPGQATSAIHNAMVSYGSVHRDGSVFSVLDPPASQNAPAIVTYVETTAALLGLSEFAAIYWPRIKIVNPNRSVFGTSENITVPPSGFVVGVYARTDSSRPGGIYQPPAGIERGIVFGMVGFEDDPDGNPIHQVVDEKKRDIVFPKRINPITVFPGTPRHIDGSRTLKGDGNFPFVAERRGVIFIEQSLKVGLLFAKHANNTPALRARVRRTSSAFLLTQMNNDAFRSKDPLTAFFVDASDALNPPSAVFAGKLTVRIGLATNKPSEFIILKVSQDTRALEEELAA